MIRKWFERREEKARQKQEREKELKQAYQFHIEKKKYEMLNSPCALRPEFGNCTDKCIHFQEGEVFYDHHLSELGVDTWLAHKLPRCRLWKE